MAILLLHTSIMQNTIIIRGQALTLEIRTANIMHLFELKLMRTFKETDPYDRTEV